MIELGAGIAIGSFFLSLGGVASIYIRAYFSSKARSNSNPSGNSNGFIRKGEHNQGLEKIETRLSSIEKKLEDISNCIYGQEARINDLGQRTASIEAVQRICQNKDPHLKEVK